MKWVQSQGAKDCGAACLATVALYHGVRIDVNQVAILAQTTRQGARLDRLRDAAGALGFAASCGKLKADGLSSMPLPAIAHVERPESDHYVVVVKRNATTIWMIDPSIGPIRKPLSDFEAEFSSFVLLLNPGQGFKQKAAQYCGPTPFGLMWIVIKSDAGLFALALISALVAASAALVGPYFLQLLFDRSGFQLDIGIKLFTEAAGACPKRS